ncbi:hypothetical protein Sjap_001574 [Stephania japonica]|uniref:Uncharacterized protein n=1 Tax=Stephania japonica TaxID=461633 RepID=A0AAP0KMI0_9MAGN
MVSEKSVIKPRTGAARSQSKPREIAEKPKISKIQLKSKTDEQVKKEDTQKNVCFEEPGKGERCSKCRGKMLEMLGKQNKKRELMQNTHHYW